MPSGMGYPAVPKKVKAPAKGKKKASKKKKK